MNSREVSEAAQKAFNRLSKLGEKEFQHELKQHADGDIAKALLDLGYFRVGEVEAEAFQFHADEIPIVVQDWHAVTFDYHVNLLTNAAVQAGFVYATVGSLTRSATTTFVKPDFGKYLTSEYYVQTEECEPCRLAA